MMSSKVIALVTGILLFVQCSEGSDQVQTKPIDNLWVQKARVEFPINLEDIAPQDISFIIRNNNEYPYSNIRFIVTLREGNAKPIAVDTLNYLLASPDGRWLGTGFGDTKELQVLYKGKFSFPKKGKYTLQIEQAMRKDTLRGVEDIGVKIEPSKP